VEEEEAPEREALEKAFRAALPEGAEIREWESLGCPSAFWEEHVFALLYEGLIVLLLDEDDRAALLAFAEAQPFEARGQRMPGFVVMPADMAKTRDELRAWMAQAARYAALLPPKEVPEEPVADVPLKRTRGAIHRSLSGGDAAFAKPPAAPRETGDAKKEP